MSAEGAVLTFKYDHNGLRTQKVVQTDWLPETTNYFLHGKLLTHMTVDYTDFDEVAHTDSLHFFYDAQSRPTQVNFNGVITPTSTICREISSGCLTAPVRLL